MSPLLAALRSLAATVRGTALCETDVEVCLSDASEELYREVAEMPGATVRATTVPSPYGVVELGPATVLAATARDGRVGVSAGFSRRATPVEHAATVRALAKTKDAVAVDTTPLLPS